MTTQIKPQADKATPIEEVLEHFLNDPCKPHFATEKSDLLKAARAEHAALCAVAEAGEVLRNSVCMGYDTSKEISAISVALGNLAAVRGGKGDK